MLDSATAGSDHLQSSANPPSEPSQAAVERQSPFPAFCDVRILNVAIPPHAASVTVRYVVTTEHGVSWMGEVECWVCEVGAGDGYDFTTHYERTTKGHEMPESLHAILEDAAETAWKAHLDGERSVMNLNAELSSAYLAWRETDAVDMFLAESATLAGCR